MKLSSINRFALLSMIGLASSLSAQTPIPIKWVAPSYPVLAKTVIETSGVVSVRILIDSSGKVISAKASSINQLNQDGRLGRLFPASEAAAQNWIFTAGPESRSANIYFAFHLYPPDTDIDHLQPEWITPNTVIVKAAVVRQPTSEMGL